MLSIILPLIFAFVLLAIGAYKFVTDPKPKATGFGVGLVILSVGTYILIELLSSYGY